MKAETVARQSSSSDKSLSIQLLNFPVAIGRFPLV